MMETTPTILPSYDSVNRPAWLVRCAQAVASSCVADSDSTEWPQQLASACDEIQAAGIRSPDPAESNYVPRPAVQHEAQSSNTDLDIAIAGELLGTMVSLISSPFLIDELCRNAYPSLWDEALDEYAANPNLPGILIRSSTTTASL